ncbi:hypothetical protein ACSSS7_006172 [Eimeria intestinalis]
MRILHGGKALLTAVAAVLSTPAYPSYGIQKINSLSAFTARLNLVGFKGPRTEAALYDIFTSELHRCSKVILPYSACASVQTRFAPPPGLSLDFTPSDTMSPDEAVGQLFTFLPPNQFIHGPMQSGGEGQAAASFAQMPADDAAGNDLFGGQGPEDAITIQPLRLVKFSSDPKHILAKIMKAVYLHFRSPTCQQAAKRLDGLRRIFLRNNSRAAAFEPLLIYALLQGNAASAAKFAVPASADLLGEGRDALMQHMAMFKSPANVSSSAGIYDPLLIATYFDLVKAGEAKQLKKFEKLLQKPVDESMVGNKLFGNSLASPSTHATITGVGKAIGTDEELLQRAVERIGQMANDSSDASSILLPQFPKIAAFVRGVSFFAFEGVFKQNRPYVMPGLPCGGNLTGNMLETVTAKKLGTSYYVYNKTALALVVSSGLTTLCMASGLLGFCGGAGCAIGAAGLMSAFMAVAPFKAKPEIPLSVATFLSTDFERNLQIASTMVGARSAQKQVLSAAGQRGESPLE